jgi:hypothetical protein
MGLTCTLFRASNAEIERVVADPDTLDALIESIEGPAPQLREVRPKGFLGFLLKLTPVTISEVVPLDETDSTAIDTDRVIDIEKGWHGLHFLLTGTSDEGDEPACYLVRGGDDIDDDGTCRALRPAQAKRFAEHLATLSPADLEKRYDPQRMTKLEIYPDVVWNRPSTGNDAPLPWLLACFADVKTFMAKAAASGDGVIVRIA